MATAETVKGKIQVLIDSSNATTGNADADLTTAVSALIAGYGQGGSDGVQSVSGTYVLTEDSSSMAIDIDDIGFVPDIAVVQLDETDFVYDSSPTKAWVLSYIPELLERSPVNAALAYSRTNYGNIWRGAQGTNTQQGVAISTNYIGYKSAADPTIKINLGRSAASYPIIAGAYNWSVYKIWGET